MFFDFISNNSVEITYMIGNIITFAIFVTIIYSWIDYLKGKD